MDLKIKVDLDRVTMDDLIALEDGKSTRAMRDILARFVVDSESNYVEYEAAKKMVGKLTLPEMNTTAAKFAEAMKGAQSAAIPPTTSGK